MGFIDDDRVVPAEQLVALDFCQQDAVGHQLDLGGLAHLPGETDLEADFLANLHAKLGGNALGHGPGCQTARLRVADQAVVAEPQFQAHLGDLRGFSGAGLAGNDGYLVGRDGGHQVLAALGYRQLGGVGNMQCHGWQQSTGPAGGINVTLPGPWGPGNWWLGPDGPDVFGGGAQKIRRV
ncbi:MAG: hypothetical protein K0S72_2302 [Arthrobacter sp.]|nr:hypothetical protein [Arthrobacter sp.]